MRAHSSLASLYQEVNARRVKRERNARACYWLVCIAGAVLLFRSIPV